MLESQRGPEHLMLGAAKDPVYMFRQNCRERKVQPLFKFRSDSTGIDMLSHVIRNTNLVKPLTMDSHGC